MYNTEQREGESTLHYYRRLAKVADQRLVRLEALKYQKHFKHVESFAYSRAMYDIRSWSGKDATRFNTKPPENEEELRAKINDIKHFIEMPTSYKQGIVNTYKKSADTLNKNYGTDFTWEDMGNFYEREHNIDWEKRLGYKTSLYTIGVMQKNKKAIKDAVERAKKDNKDIRVVSSKEKVKDDRNVYVVIDSDYNEKIEKALNDDKLSLSDIGL